MNAREVVQACRDVPDTGFCCEKCVAKVISAVRVLTLREVHDVLSKRTDVTEDTLAAVRKLE